MTNAETVASTVLYLTRKMGSKGTLVGKEPSPLGLSRGAAFYTIWIMADGKHGLPLYAGYTGRNLAERIKNHTNVQGGVLNRIFTGGVKIGQLPVYSANGVVWVEYLSASAALAAAIEGAFLSMFDFALNTANNSAARALDPVGEPSMQEPVDLSKVVGEFVRDFKGDLEGLLKDGANLLHVLN